jgi:hypothetical protein
LVIQNAVFTENILCAVIPVWSVSYLHFSIREAEPLFHTWLFLNFKARVNAWFGVNDAFFLEIAPFLRLAPSHMIAESFIISVAHPMLQRR